jgi:hypothetical protein
MISYQQDDWIKFLPMAEFAYNNTFHSSTGVTPFFANYGFQPGFSIGIHTSSVNTSTEEWAHLMKEIHQDMYLELSLAQDRHKERADRHQLTTPGFKVGDMVWLLRRHIATTRPCHKLDFKKLGPFRIVDQVHLVAFRLNLPSHYRICNIFHISILELYHSSSVQGRQIAPPPTVALATGDEYEVEKILDSCKSRRNSCT